MGEDRISGKPVHNRVQRLTFPHQKLVALGGHAQWRLQEPVDIDRQPSPAAGGDCKDYRDGPGGRRLALASGEGFEDQASVRPAEPE